LDKSKPDQLEKMSIDKNQLSVIKFGWKNMKRMLNKTWLTKSIKRKRISQTTL